MLIEYFTQWLENRGLISLTRQECVPPDVIDPSKENTIKTVTRKAVIPEKFKDDIKKLFEFIGRDAESSCFSDLCITLSLQEALTLMPRARKRADAYGPLVRFLHDQMGITLNIISQKPRNHD